MTEERETSCNPDDVFTEADAQTVDTVAQARVDDDLDYSGLFDYGDETVQKAASS